MGLVTTAVAVYAVVIAYLIARGVGLKQILQIAASGIFGGLVLAYTLGFGYFAIVLVKPAETIAVFSIAMLLFGAAYIARDHILGSITPLGVIFLNIAANFFPGDGPLPLSFAWLAALPPIPYGALRVALSLIVLYLPALFALAALRRGPPGDPWLRLLLGMWVCWVGIAAVVGPGWTTIAEFRVHSPVQWFACIALAYAATHAAMLALNLAFVVSDKDDASARSLVRSVRIDRTSPARALFLGAAFWLGMYLFARLPMSDSIKASLAIAAAFGLGELLARKPAPDSTGDAPEISEQSQQEKRRPILGDLRHVGGYLAFLGIFGFISYLTWERQESRRGDWESKGDFTDDDFGTELVLLGFGSVTTLALAMIACALYEGLSGKGARRGSVYLTAVALFLGYRAFATPLSPLWSPPSLTDQLARAQQAARVPSGMFLRDENAAQHSDLKARLDAAGVPYTVRRPDGRKEFLHVAEEHRSAAKEVLAAIEGPPLPFNRSGRFHDATMQQEFTAWLTTKGVKWEMVTKRYEEYVVWDAVPGHECLSTAFENTRRSAWIGIDYYALASVRTASHCELVRMPRAAFEGPNYRDSFIAWARTQDVRLKTATLHGYEFVEWEPPRDDLLNEYIGVMRGKCLEDYRARYDDAQKRGGALPVNACFGER